MFGFLQVPASSILVSLYNEDERSVACARVAFKEDGHAVSILHTAITLINTCNIEQLEKIPWKLSEKFLDTLKRLWEKEHNQMLLGNAWTSCQEGDLNLSNVKVNNLAECIFRLSTNASEFVTVLVDRKIFGWSELSFEKFMLHQWESSPSLVRRLSGSLIEEDDIFSSFAQSLNCKEASPTFLSSVLQSFVSCVPIASDELNIISFLEEVRSELGCPINYQQDIRVLRTERPSKKEQPRMYDPLDREHCFGEENSLAGCRKFLLREGNILYVPRGFPHEACRHDGGSSDLARFSLHITFGIEVEPPFEWEGFAHVALHCWYQTQKQLHRASVEPLSGILDLMPVTLLHVMVELIGASDSTLRRASLVGAHFLPLEVNDWLNLDQKTTFNHIIDQINKASKFFWKYLEVWK